ncbi:hypothetical protein HN958_03645 [Candidatus Falkowbacteria bacterium]|jgi:hypothetical protein|nr:hypothetical protein [Candidatus Falkowbacteria bacterium]MBT7007571.1 hypothetical protein [Candidatus Falkowbacteria bacterium]
MKKVANLSFLIVAENKERAAEVREYLCHVRGVPTDQVLVVSTATEVSFALGENEFDVVLIFDNVDSRGMEHIQSEGLNQAHHAGLRLALYLQKMIKRVSYRTRLAYLWVQDYNFDYIGSLQAAVEPDGFVHQAVPGELAAAMEEFVYWAVDGGYHLVVSNNEMQCELIARLLAGLAAIPERFFLTVSTVEQALDVVEKYPSQLSSVIFYEHVEANGGERIGIDPADNVDKYWAGVNLAKYLVEFFLKKKWDTKICFAFGVYWNYDDQTMLPKAVGEDGLVLEFSMNAREFGESIINWLYNE